ncbi:FRG domain-containing protein [Bacillus toyonensis]|nr:FRG domain-containing protein [Bacillus toyonensis]
MLTDFNITFADYFNKNQEALASKLKNDKIEDNTIHQILDSGYFLWGDTVHDGYYGPTGRMHYNYFLSILKGATVHKSFLRNIPIYEINSYKDAKEVLELPIYKRIADDICFRGQNQHFSSQRPFPHPFFSDKKGNETLLLPGFWRKFLIESNYVSIKRPMDKPTSFLENSCISDRLHFHGIDVPELRKINFERYGLHFDSNLEDFPDSESQEFASRYNQKLSIGNEQPLIEQHYGLQTVGLDVTFDLKTALFFATNKYTQIDDGKSTYTSIANENKGIIYLLRFKSPKLMKTRDLISSINAFKHMTPVRPIKQSCALPFFLSHYVNDAAAHIIGILKIGENFTNSELYNPTDLFPPKEQDPFYKALLELKKEFPEALKDIANYDFS